MHSLVVRIALRQHVPLRTCVEYPQDRGLLAILLLIFTGSVEIAQLFVPGRHARLSDFVVDASAMWIGLIGVWLFRHTRDSVR